MTRFGHELNYVINTFVKRTPGPQQFLIIRLNLKPFFLNKTLP